MVYQIVFYGILVVLTVFLSTKLGFYVDQIDKKSNLSSAFIGGVLLAAVTSLPELFTSISSVVLVEKPALVLGNILGSNLFNSMVLGLVFLLYGKHVVKKRLVGSHLVSLRSVLLIFAMLLFPLFLEKSPSVLSVSVYSLVILAVYLISFRSMSQDENAAEDDDLPCPLTLRQIAVRFVFSAGCLIAVSILLTYASDTLGAALGFGATAAGALLLGVVTSLPELISCFVLAKARNFNAVTGNIVGSNLFNFLILVVADICAPRQELYQFDPTARLLVWLGLAGTLSFSVLLTLHRNKTSGKVSFGVCCAIPLVCYGIFAVFGT